MSCSYIARHDELKGLDLTGHDLVYMHSTST